MTTAGVTIQVSFDEDSKTLTVYCPEVAAWGEDIGAGATPHAIILLAMDLFDLIDQALATQEELGIGPHLH